MLKRFVLPFFIFCLTAAHSFGQDLKKKYQGTFTGTIPSYIIELGEELIHVDGTALSLVILSENKLEETIGSTKTEGTYRISAESKNTLTIQVNYPNQLVYEELIINKKEKTIVRKGFYPQPECVLVKE